MDRRNGITIEEALKMDCMQGSRLISGFKGVKNVITSVNVMADPDVISWVGSGDFLLTTGYSFKESTLEEQKSIIKEASKKGLSGIGIKIYPYLQQLDSELLGLSEDLDFPIIEINHETSLSDIMTPIFNEIFNRQAHLLKKTEKIYEQFMNAMLKGKNIREITRLISDNIKNPVLLRLDFFDEEIVEFDEIEEVEEKLLLENSAKFYKNSDRHKEKKIDESDEEIGSLHVKRIIVPIVAKGSVFGHIFAWGIKDSLERYELSVLEIASTTIALEVLKMLSVREVENRYKSEFIEDLISLDKKRKEKAVERAEFFDLSIRDRFLSVTIKINRRGSEERQLKEMDVAVNPLEQQLSKVHDYIERTIRNLKLKGVVASKTERIIVLLSFKEDEDISISLKEFKRQISEMDKRFKQIEISAGIGRVVKDLENFEKSYDDSIKAIATGKILESGLVTSYDNLGIYKILSQDCLEEELSEFYNSTLMSLVEYDKKKSTELIKTLESYFNNNGNLKKMSDELFTHYNTILYRIQRIMDITYMDLENSSDRLNLEISLKIKKLLNK